MARSKTHPFKGRQFTAEEGQMVAATEPAADGAQILAVCADDGLRLVRQPEGGNLTLPFPATLALLAATFPAAW